MKMESRAKSPAVHCPCSKVCPWGRLKSVTPCPYFLALHSLSWPPPSRTRQVYQVSLSSAKSVDNCENVTEVKDIKMDSSSPGVQDFVDTTRRWCHLS